MEQPTFQTPVAPPEPKKSNFLTLILLVLLAFLLGAGVMYAWQNYSQLLFLKTALPPKVTPTPIPTPTPTATPTPSSQIPIDWKAYRNEEYGFSLSYPPNFQISSLPLKSDYLVDGPVSLWLVLIQDIYLKMAQTPVLNLKVVKTTKTVDEMIAYVQQKNEEGEKAMKDPQSMGYGQKPPKINSIKKVTINQIEMTKVDRYGGPGAPNVDILEYYYKSPTGSVYIFSANYGTYNPDVKQDGTVEKETLPQILSTFRFD